MLVPITKTLWQGKVGSHDFGAHNAAMPTTSVPMTSITMGRVLSWDFTSSFVSDYNWFMSVLVWCRGEVGLTNV